MFEKVLIANRGEIAARIARTCKELGVASVAVYSEADEGAPHTRLADEAYCIGEPHVTKSYLNMDAILEVAEKTGAQAVHPGYGLLSENEEFVQRVEDAGMTFIGPSPRAMQLMGDKAAARAFAKKAGVPVVPGSEGPIEDEEQAVEFAAEFGYPLLVKASGGGGGIGMKLATKEKQLRKAFQECQRRGESAFGNPEVYLERYIENPRHIEVQVFGDTHGNHVHLFERECSVQRRHQKVIEEAPSPAAARFTTLRKRITTAAVALARSARYVNAGTVEFIFSDATDEFFFIEMNTRLQVEHPVTEMITGFDLVEWQLRIAAGEPLPVGDQDEIRMNGHAIECRIYAENPDKMFMPAPGDIGRYSEPARRADVRVDSGVQANWKVTPFYDPLLAKVITHGSDRDQARYAMLGALDEMKLEGLTTNIDMHRWILQHEDFAEGHVHTAWLELQRS